jgi:putative ATP-dependent endonuclease of OLD family
MKALNAAEIFRCHEDYSLHLPTNKIDDEDVCGLEIIFEKLFY